MTDENGDTLILELYGIDDAQRRVDNVGIYASGRMAHWSERRGYIFYELADDNPRQDVARVFGWSNVTELGPGTPNSRRRQILIELQARARGDQPDLKERPSASTTPEKV
jgi:hypothetical protein